MSSVLLPYINLFCRGLQDSVQNSFRALTIDDDFSTNPSRHIPGQHHPHQPKPKNSIGAPSTETKRVKKNLGLLCLFNGGILLMGMLCFHYAFLPIFSRLFFTLAGENAPKSSLPLVILQKILTYAFNVLWLVPAFIISKFVNCYWFRETAEVVFKKLTKKTQPMPGLALSRSISDFLFSLVVQIFFLIQSTLILLLPVPVVNFVLGHLCLCLLYSFYAFEYGWIYRNLTVKQRIERIQLFWPYFIGFGLPLTILSTQMSTSMIANECIFSILFPFAIVAATSVKLRERVVVSSSSTPIVYLNIFSICIRLTSRLFDMVKPGRKMKTNPGTSTIDQSRQ